MAEKFGREGVLFFFFKIRNQSLAVCQRKSLLFEQISFAFLVSCRRSSSSCLFHVGAVNLLRRPSGKSHQPLKIVMK